jgi:hypothetical protein
MRTVPARQEHSRTTMGHPGRNASYRSRFLQKGWVTTEAQRSQRRIPERVTHTHASLCIHTWFVFGFSVPPGVAAVRFCSKVIIHFAVASLHDVREFSHLEAHCCKAIQDVRQRIGGCIAATVRQNNCAAQVVEVEFLRHPRDEELWRLRFPD